MISYIHRNTKMVPSFNRDLKPTFKRSSFAIWWRLHMTDARRRSSGICKQQQMYLLLKCLGGYKLPYAFQ
ncbi:hypothetical protein HanPI659440_Chr11g0441791 [Helianthus annuus]|nr:hypothetical protein HanPI659440_Chr11g0441791 [Helianthus annuus]